MLVELLTRSYRLFISRRFAVSLLIAISILLFLGIILPTLSYHEPSEMMVFEKNHPVLFELGKVFNPPTLTTSWTFLFLTGMLMLSTFLCCIERLRNREYRDPYTSLPKFFRHRLKLSLSAGPDEARERAAAVLRRRWWRLGPGRSHDDLMFLEGRKGAFGFWGSLVFHLGFLIILGGVIMSSLTRFSGTLLLAEGQETPLLSRNLMEVSRKPMLAYELPGVGVFLERFKADIRGNVFPVDYTADVVVFDAARRAVAKPIKVNQAVKHEEVSMLLRDYGFAPQLVLRDRRGKILGDAFFNLKKRRAGVRDSVRFPKTDVVVDTRFFPDYNLTSSVVPRSPAIAVEVKKKGSPVFKGLLRRGESVKFNGMTLGFPSLRYWAYFQVTRDLGLAVVFWGFVISFVGLVIRFFWHDRQLLIRIKPIEGGTELLISGRSKYFPTIFKEELKKVGALIETGPAGGVRDWVKPKQSSFG